MWNNGIYGDKYISSILKYVFMIKFLKIFFFWVIYLKILFSLFYLFCIVVLFLFFGKNLF